MNKSELIQSIATQADLTKAQAASALQAFKSTVSHTLAKGNEVVLTGFGSFKVTNRIARTGRNPKTGEKVEISAAKVPSFKAGKGLKEAVN